MSIVEVRELTKKYPSFELKQASFNVEQGRITGFIGRNGAGKTTTIKSMLNLIHTSGGEIRYFGMPLQGHETEIKQRIGYSTGTVSWYPRKTIKEIVAVTKLFYPNWDEEAYRKYLAFFGLDENKKPIELSEGMKVKFNLLLALSHRAEVLILDEPTSGLDPVSRDELLEIFRTIIEDGKHSILFSTHIISDLEKCADYITYIKGGKILCSSDVETFKDAYRLVSGEAEQLQEYRDRLVGYRAHAFGFTGLMRREDAEAAEGLKIAPADMESIMIYTEKEDGHESAAE